MEFDEKSVDRIADVVRTVERQSPKVKGAVPDSVIFQFELLEDVTSDESYAELTAPDGTDAFDRGVLVNKWGVLDGATAGYQGDCYYFDGRYYLIHGPCVVPCVHDPAATINVSAPLEVPKDSPITPFDITASGPVNTGSFGVSGLPPGITSNKPDETTLEIDGTPTTAGQYEAIVTFTTPELDSNGDPTGENCTITKVQIFNITP